MPRKSGHENTLAENPHIIFFHPDYTVGFGIAPNQPSQARRLYCRSGITPCPEDIYYNNIISSPNIFVNTLHWVNIF